GADGYQFGQAALAVAGDVSRCLAAAGRMADVDGVAQVEVLDDRGDVGGVVVHVVAVADLARTAVSAPVVGDDAVALPNEEEHLGVPVVGTQRPAVMEHDRLCVPAAPVLVVNLNAVFGADEAHVIVSILVVSKVVGCFPRWRQGGGPARVKWRVRSGRIFRSMARADNKRPPGLCRRGTTPMSRAAPAQTAIPIASAQVPAARGSSERTGQS